MRIALILSTVAIILLTVLMVLFATMWLIASHKISKQNLQGRAFGEPKEAKHETDRKQGK